VVKNVPLASELIQILERKDFARFVDDLKRTMLQMQQPHLQLQLPQQRQRLLLRPVQLVVVQLKRGVLFSKNNSKKNRKKKKKNENETKPKN